jgi:hypothetical protein
MADKEFVPTGIGLLLLSLHGFPLGSEYESDSLENGFGPARERGATLISARSTSAVRWKRFF